MSTTWLWYATRGAGAVSLLLLSAVTVLGVLSTARFESARWPRFLTTGFHRNLGLLAVLFLSLHVVTAVVDPFTHLGWLAALVPFGSYYRTLWLGLGTVAFEFMLAVVASSLLRSFLGRPAWRAIHWLGYASWPIAVVHGIGTGTDAFSTWLLAIDAICVIAVAAAVIGRIRMSPRDSLKSQRERFRVSARSGAGS